MKRRKRCYRWKQIVALVMAGLMLAESVPVNVYAAPVSEEREQEETKQMFTIPIKEMATIKNGGVESLHTGIVGMAGSERVFYFQIDLSGIEEGESIYEAVLNLTAGNADTCKEQSNLTMRDLTGHVAVSGSAVSVVKTEDSTIGDPLSNSLKEWNEISETDAPVVAAEVSVKKGEQVGVDLTEYLVQAVQNGQKELTLAVYGAEEADWISEQALELAEVSLSVAVSDKTLSVITESDKDAKAVESISIEKIVSVNNQGKFQSPNSNSNAVGMVGRGRVMYFELDLSGINIQNGQIISDAGLKITSAGASRNVVVRDVTGYLEISDISKVPDIVENQTVITKLPTTLEAWSEIGEEKVPVIKTASIPTGEITIDFTNYIAKAVSEGKSVLTLAVYGSEDDYGDGAGNSNKPTLDPKEISLSVMVSDSAEMAHNAIIQLEKYLKEQYGEDFYTLLSEVKLPDDINTKLGISEDITWNWTGEKNGEKIIYTATATYQGKEEEKSFEFSINAFKLAPSILRVKLYSDEAGTQPLEKPTASNGASGWYLRSDYVTFLSFDLTELLKVNQEKYIKEALFQVTGNRKDGGASNLVTVICLDESVTETSMIPIVTLRSGEKESLSAENLTQIAGTTILSEQKISQLNKDTSELELSESIFQAVRDGKERITFLLISEGEQSTGCDLNPGTAVLHTKFADYTDEKWCEEAVNVLKEKYENYYASQQTDLMTSYRGENSKVTITWKSSDTSVISDQGVVASNFTGTKEVTMTATVTCGTASKEIILPFLACDSNYAVLYQVLESVKQQMDYLQNNTITKDIVLAGSSKEEVTVTWESDKPDFIDNTGKVTPPKTNEPNEEVALTAKIALKTDSSVQAEYSLKLTVAAGKDIDNAAAQAQTYLDLLKQMYNNSIAVEDLILPAVMAETDKTTTKVEWSLKKESDYYKIGELTEDGYPVTVTQPEQPQKVLLHCKVSTTGKNNTAYTAVKEADFVITVVSEQEESPYGRESLQYMVNFGNALYQQINGNEQVLSTKKMDGEFDDIYDVQNSYSLQLECNITDLIENEKFPFLYYPYEYDGITITSYKKMQIAGTGTTTASTPGALDAEKAEKFLQALQDGEAALASRDAQTERYKAALNTILTTGTELLESAKIDNTIAVRRISTGGNHNTARENRLVFSKARRELLVKVWEAKTTLYQDAGLYLLSDKRALTEQIQNSENALSGTYDYPQNTYREFRTRRDDEVLIFCLSHQVRFRNYDSTIYGLDPMLSYYKEQAVLSGSYYETVIPVSEALAINEQGSTISCGSAAELTVGMDSNGLKRFALLKFDLSSIPGEVQFASLQLTSKKNDSSINYVILEDEDNWSGSGSYQTLLDKYGKDSVGGLAWKEENRLANFSPLGNGKRSLMTITDAVVAEKAKDNQISLRIQPAAITTYPNGYVGTENTEYSAEDWPVLRVTVGIVDNDLLEKNQEEILDSKREFLDSIQSLTVDIGSYGSYHYGDAKAGEYPEDLYLQAEEAYQSVENASGVYKKSEALVKLCDAVRILKDNQILATDIDSTANIFFSAEEMEALRDRIASSSELSEKYKEIRAVSDTVSLEDLRTLKEAIFTSDTNQIDKLGILDFSGIGSGSNAKTIKTAEMNLIGGKSASDVAYGEFVVRLDNGKDYQGNGVDNGYFAYVDTFVLKDSASVEVTNSSFDQDADGWRYVGIDTSYQSAEDATLKGSSGEWTKTVSSLKETGCLYLENQTADANGAWVSKRFEMQPGSYSLTYQLKQHIVFLGKGVTTVVRYYDKDGNYIGYSGNYGNNFKSAASYGAWGTRFQADALVYAVSGDEEYAEKCILDLILGANDFAQGSEHWMYNNSRPYGIDAYGAVQGGRFVNCLATAYSIVKNSPKWSEEDRQLLADLCLYITGDLNDIRDRSEMTAAEAAYGTTNWNMDMAIGSAMLGLAFNGMKGWEYGRQYYNNGYNTVLGQCTEINIYGQDGSWNESVRYHNAAISKICVFAKAIRNMAGVNWFAEDADVQLGKSLFYNVLVQTPAYAYSDTKRYIGTPAYGDHVLTNGSEFAYLGLYFDEVAKVNPIQAYSMYKTWEKAGSPLPGLSGESNMMESFFAPLEFSEDWLGEYSLSEAEKAYQSIGSTDTGSMGVDADLNGIVTEEENQNVMDYWEELERAETASSSNEYKSHGITIFRNHFNEEDKESYLSMMANEYSVAHNHEDQLGIQLFANSTPLILDVGIGGYWDLSKATYSLSSAHGLTQFINADGSEKAALNASKVVPAAAQLDFYASDLYDFMSAQTWRSDSHTDGTITRNIGYIKNGWEAYIIWDQVENEAEDMKAQYNLPLYAKETPTIDYENNRITMNGFHDTNLDILFLEGNLTAQTATIDTIMLPTSYIVEKRDPKDSAATVDLLHVKSEKANEDFVTVLFPSDAKTEQQLEAKKIESTIQGIQIYQLTYADEKEMQKAYVILNKTKRSASVSLSDITEELVNLKEVSAGAVDKTNISVEANSMVVLAKIKEETECTHTNTTVKNTKEATCEEAGYTGDTYCDDCGEKLKEGTEIEALGHDYTSEITKEPTIEEAGIRTYTCTRCGNTYTESVGKLNCSHTNTKVKNQKEATCEEAGYTGDTYCADCGEKLKEGTEIEALGHDYTSEITKEPTTEEAGIRTYTCTRCGNTYTENIGKLNCSHTKTVVKDAKEATCEEAGYTGDTYCDDCGKKLESGMAVEALGHNYTSEITKEPTKEEEGIRTYTCTRCSKTYTEKIEKLPNTDIEPKPEKPDVDEEEDDSEDSYLFQGIQNAGVGKIYLKADETIARNEWIWHGNHWYYAGANGILKTGWLQTSDGKWYYLSKDCTMKTGWEYVNGKWYYLEDTNGDMLEGWKYTGGKWYYLNLVSGDMAVGWKQVNGKWYYLEDKNGDMLEGWKYTNGKWYYLNPVSGDMAVGWKQINGKWYYLNPINGDMAVGWKQIGDKWYYLDLEGDCLLNTITPDGYAVNQNGEWIR